LGQVKSRRDFLPFGEDLFINVGARSLALKYSASADDIRQKFTGYQKDTETNLDFAEARMYENRFGRFTAVDPLLASGKSANPQTFNRYIYVGNSPLRRVDKNGLDWWDIVNKATKTREIMWFDEDPEEDFYEIKERWTNYVYLATDKKWHALNPYTGESESFADENAAKLRYGRYTDFNGDFDGLLYQALGVKDIAYLVANMRTGNFDGALFDFTYISATNGAGGGIGRYMAPVDDVAMLGLKQSDDFLATTAASSIIPKATSSLGRWGEARLAQVLGGAGERPSKAMATSLGNRFVDRLVDGVAHEAKAGLNVGLTPSIRNQILKDAELIRNNVITGARWHFFQGAQKETLDFLAQNGIPYSLY